MRGIADISSSVADRRALAKPSRLWHRCRSRSMTGVTRACCESAQESPTGAPHSSHRKAPRSNREEEQVLPKSLRSASDRKKWGKQAIGPGLHRVLFVLWDHAHGWRPGEPSWFVWPSITSIAAELGFTEDGIRRCLRGLASRGWIVVEVNDGHKGWRLFPEPPQPTQLDLFASEIGEPAAVDKLCTSATNHRAEHDEPSRETRGSVAPLLSTGTEGTVSEPRAHDDADVLRTWNASEAERVRLLGGRPAQPSPPPEFIAASRRWGTERLGKAAIDGIRLAADARARGRHVSQMLVAACTDARAWTDHRIESIEAWMERIGGELVCAAEAVPRSHAPPDPVVDGERVDIHEREAWESGGSDAVRAQRLATLSPVRMAALAAAARRSIGGAQ